ncbi:MAG: hypothetical protein L3J65_05250 [Robiginitomaculum sp.]|nr:hypothetical protein [Robiginitomaculum sp.]
MKKMLFVTALTIGLGATTANAQEQVQEQVQEQMQEQVQEQAEQVMTEATESVEKAVDGATTMVVPAKAAGPEGMWVRRKKGQDVRVSFKDGAMYCTIINRTKKSGKAKKDFEMCHGMMAEGDAWKGKKMKHPEMPKFMTFKGTVTVEGDVLKIKGCAGICDSEKWDRAKPAEAAKVEEMKSE